jgi:hypothetical protein
MKFIKFVHKLYFYLLAAIKIQVFITLVALPTLVCWGLPISKLTIIGNILFAPILTIFLLLSSIIFFSELMYLPNDYAIYLLEKLTHFWLNIAPNNPKNYFLAFPQVTWFIFVLGLIAVILTFLYLKTSKTKQAIVLCLILFSSCIIAKLPFWITTDHLTVCYRTQKMNLYCHSGEVTVHDYGTLNYYCGVESWIQFTLMPTLIKNFGTLKIKKLVIHRPVKSTAKNVEFLQQQLIIAHTQIPNYKIKRKTLANKARY